MRNKFVRVFIMLILIVALFIPSATANAEVRSLFADWFNPTLTKDTLITDNVIYTDVDRENIQGQGSIYDQYGDDIYFVGYLGEKEFKIGVIDQVYSCFSGAIELNFSDLKNLFTSVNSGINSIVYPNRIKVINDESDPRYVAYKRAFKTTTDVAYANAFLGITKTLNGLFRYVICKLDVSVITNVYDTLVSNEVLINAYKGVLGLFIFVFMIRLIGITFAFLKGKGVLIVIKTLGNAILAGVIIVGFLAMPSGFNSIYVKFNDEFDNYIVENVVSDNNYNSIVKGSTDEEDAYIWYKTIFEPWCIGTFGLSYDECNVDTFPVSNGDINSATKEEPVPNFYATGVNFKVPNINGDENNIAAFAYSCQSKYHYDTTLNSYEVGVTENNYIYNDDFKWVDALMNISNEYISVSEVSGAITNECNPYYENFFIGSLDALFRTIFGVFPLFCFTCYYLFYFGKAVLSFFNAFIKSTKFFINPDLVEVSGELLKILISVWDLFLAFVVKFIVLVIFYKLSGTIFSYVLFTAFCLLLAFGSRTFVSYGIYYSNMIKNKIIRRFNDNQTNIIKKAQEKEDSKEDEDEEVSTDEEIDDISDENTTTNSEDENNESGIDESDEDTEENDDDKIADNDKDDDDETEKKSEPDSTD